MHDVCQFFYECGGCGELLKPLKGDCCVYCSYGDTKCPPLVKADAQGLSVDPGQNRLTRTSAIHPKAVVSESLVRKSACDPK